MNSPALSKRRDWANVGHFGPDRESSGDKLSKSLARLGLIGALALGACESQPLEVNQVAQQSMIGLSKREILACFGPPAARAPAGEATEIWTYVGGQMRGYGPQWAIPLNTNLLPYTPPGRCDVVMTMTNARVSEVGYAAIDGGALPLGQECLFPVERCVKAP
jgi:hypothetical protein